MNEQRFVISDFSKVWVESALSVDIRRSDDYSVTAAGDDFNHVRVEKTGDTLKIRRRGLDLIAIFRARPNISITMPHLDELVLSGASQVKASGFDSDHALTVKLSGASHLEIISISSGNSRMDITGASNVSGDIEVSGDIVFNINGASRAELAGSGNGARLELAGASQARLANFTLNNVKASISGASSSQLKVDGNLDVNLSGASRLEYSGNPTLGNVSVSGASTLKRR
jgi:hypothetical protein